MKATGVPFKPMHFPFVLSRPIHNCFLLVCLFSNTLHRFFFCVRERGGGRGKVRDSMSCNKEESIKRGWKLHLFTRCILHGGFLAGFILHTLTSLIFFAQITAALPPSFPSILNEKKKCFFVSARCASLVIN